MASGHPDMNTFPHITPFFASGLETTEPLSDSMIIVQLITILFLIALKGLFVAAEFGLVKVRASQIDELITEGRSPSHALRVKAMIVRLNDYVGATQFGITLTSIALSMLGEKYMVPWLAPHLAWTGLPDWWVHVIAFVIILVFLTFIDVVFGELIPKTVAIRQPLGTTMKLSGPLSGFEFSFRWAIRILNRTADWMLRTIFRMKPAEEHENVHSAEELQILVAESQRSKQVTPTERDISINALELNDLVARDVMTPRTEIIALDPRQPFADNLKIALESKHTRFPLRERNLDNCLGVVHIKDFIRIIDEAKPDLVRIKRDLIIAPETQPLDELLKTFLARRGHMALVVDEFGATVGMVTLEDVLEELVGEIEDEFDSPGMSAGTSGFMRVSETEFMVDGKFPLYSLAELSDVDLESEEVSTIGGYVTSELGHLPVHGETIQLAGYAVIAESVDERRIVKLRFKKYDPASVAAEEARLSRGGQEE